MTKPHLKLDAAMPEGWTDRTVIMYTNPNKSPGTSLDSNIAISRDAMQKDETFGAFIERQMKVMGEEIPQFEVISKRKGKMIDKPAYDLSCNWMTPGGRVQQRVVFISIGKGQVATVAATTEDGDFHNHETVFNNILASLAIVEAPTV